MALKEKRVVIPEDMGKSIEFGSTEADKWNVKVDGTTLIRKTDGSLAVAPAGCHRITNMNRMTGLPSGNGTYCIYGAQTPQTPLVGAPTDANSANETQRRLAASIATNQDYDWNGIAIRADAQLTVYLNNGNATWMSTNDSGDESESGWSEWRRVENMPAAPTSNGLDCAAIAALPKKPWAKGTTILARGADGACHQLTALDSIFQEVGVGITASKLYGLTGEKYHVVVTVTNTGEGTNDRTDLTITKPAFGNYTTTNFTTSKAGATAITRGANDFIYTITGLTKGGTAKVEFDVTPNSVGTFQFQASINPNSALDQQSNNNTATVTLSATTNTAPNYTPSVDCPYITARMGNRQLLVSSDDTDLIASNPNSYEAYTERVNVVDMVNLNGQTVTLTNASSVVVFASLESNYIERSVIMTNGKIVQTGLTGTGVHRSTPSVDMSGGVSGYTYQNGTLRFTKPYITATIFARPAGENCKWQAVRIAGSKELTKTLVLNAAGVTAQKEQVYNQETSDSNVRSYGSWAYPDGVSMKTTIRRPIEATVQDALTIRVPRNTAKTFSVTASGADSPGYFSSSVSKGKTAATPNADGTMLNVVIAANAQPTDSITLRNVKIIIE